MCCSTNASFYASHKPRFLFLAFIQFASNSPHIQSCTTLATKNTLFTFRSSSSPPSCYIITAAISKPRAAFLRPSRGDMTDIHAPKAREREEIGPKRANDKTRFGDFSAPKVLFPRVRVCEAYAAASLTATFFFLFPLIYHDWAPLPNRNASATAAAMTQDLYSAQIFASRNWLDDRLTNAAWRRRRKRRKRKRYVLQTSNA